MTRWFSVALDRYRHSLRLRHWAPHLATGRRGEDLAHRFLERNGWRIVARNYRTHSGAGEIDLIAWEGSTLVFVEVKTRTSDAVSAPERNVDAGKGRRMRIGIHDYLRRLHRFSGDWRSDLITIVLEPCVNITHYRGAFSRT